MADPVDERSSRLQWADVAKGACIVLVVLWHVTRKDYLTLPWQLGAPINGAWGLFSEVLLPVRMPLFFLISGLFAARQLNRPWGRVWSGRIASVGYLFLLWTLVHAVFLQLTPGFDTAIARTPLELLATVSVTPGDVWYLGALAAYVAVARATRAAPGWALAAALTLSAVAAAGLVPTPGNRYGLLTNLVWFLLGTWMSRSPLLARRLTRTARPAVPVLAFAVAAALWQVLGADTWFGGRPALGLLGITAGVVGACLFLHQLLERMGATWLFTAPWLSRPRATAAA